MTPALNRRKANRALRKALAAGPPSFTGADTATATATSAPRPAPGFSAARETSAAAGIARALHQLQPESATKHNSNASTASAFDLSLELDETVIASVSLAYEASRLGQLQTALTCIHVGRTWLGSADERGRRSLQAWQDDKDMLRDAEAHIRARHTAKQTIRQLEDLLQLDLKQICGDRDAESIRRTEKLVDNHLLDGLVKALAVLNEEINGDKAPTSDKEEQPKTPKIEFLISFDQALAMTRPRDEQQHTTTSRPQGQATSTGALASPSTDKLSSSLLADFVCEQLKSMCDEDEAAANVSADQASPKHVVPSDRSMPTPSRTSDYIHDSRTLCTRRLPGKGPNVKSTGSWVHELNEQLKVLSDKASDETWEAEEERTTRRPLKERAQSISGIQPGSTNGSNSSHGHTSSQSHQTFSSKSNRLVDVGTQTAPADTKSPTAAFASSLASAPSAALSSPMPSFARIDVGEDNGAPTSVSFRSLQEQLAHAEFLDWHRSESAERSPQTVKEKEKSKRLFAQQSEGTRKEDPTSTRSTDIDRDDQKEEGRTSSVAPEFSELERIVKTKLEAEDLARQPQRNSKTVWAIWLPPLESSLQRCWASTTLSPRWSSTPGQDGELGYLPAFQGNEGKTWFGEALKLGLLLMRVSVRLPNAYGSPGYMEMVLRGMMERRQGAKIRWFAVRCAPGALAPPRVLDQFLVEAEELESVQLFILPDLEKKHGGVNGAASSASGATKGGAGAGAGGGDPGLVMARLPTNLLSFSAGNKPLRRLGIVSPSYRTDFHFDMGAISHLSQLEHLVLVLDAQSDIDVDWIRAVLRLCGGRLESLQLSGVLTVGMSQPAGGVKFGLIDSLGGVKEGEQGMAEPEDEDCWNEGAEDEDDVMEVKRKARRGHRSAQSSPERSKASVRGAAGHANGHGRRSSLAPASTEMESAVVDTIQLMSSLKRLVLEDTAASGTAAQDLFESMQLPALKDLVLAGPRLDRALSTYSVTHLSLWPAPGANAHLPTHMSLSRPKQWVTRMLIHLENVVHLELGVTQRASAISRGLNTDEIVSGIGQVIVDLEAELLVLEPEGGEAPPQPLGRPLLGSVRSLVIHHLPFDGVSLGRAIMARQRMAAALADRGRGGMNAFGGPSKFTSRNGKEADRSGGGMAGGRQYWPQGGGDAETPYFYELDDDFDQGTDEDEDDGNGPGSSRTSRVGQAVALEKVRLVRCERVTQAMRNLIQRHLKEFVTE
ncbi:hypothetical protein V8E36_008480 [Tilletia maclaganii]